MTFAIIGSERAPGILDGRPAGEPSTVSSSTGDLLLLFALDRLPSRRRLVCYWDRGPDGRLACRWEPDIAPALSR